MDTNNYNEGQGVGTETETTDDFQDPVLAAYQTEGEQQHWIDELEAARKEREKFVKRGNDTIKRYTDDRDASSTISRYNIFFANTEIKMASLYARTPKPDIARRFAEPTDQVARVAANILERNISYELDIEGFDGKIKQMLFDRLVPGMGIGWARLDQTEGDYDYDAHTGAPIQDSHIKHQCAELDYVAWNDFVWAPCRVWTDCRWAGRRVPMSKEAIKARFGGTADKTMLSSLSFTLPSALAPQSSADVTRPKNITVATVDVFELWDKERGLIFWISEGCDKPLDVQKDTNEFPGFFPTPLPPMCRTSTSSTTPVSDFSLVQDLYNELDALNDRATKLVRALQLKFVYDAKNTALKNLYTTTAELEGVGVQDWSVTQNESGGIRGSIEFVPLQEIADTYMKLVQARDAVKAQIMEVEGISDFLRGVQQPYVTAAASQATSQASSTRLSVMQMEVAEYIQRLLRLKAHLICKFYTGQTMMNAVGSMAPADMQYVPQALQLLADEQMNHFRLNVSVDSIQQLNYNQEKADKNEALHAITAVMSQILPAAQQNPHILPLGIEMLKWLVSDYKGAKGLEGTLDSMLDQLTQQVAQQGQQPPQPSPAQMKAQAQMAQIQSDQRIAQIQAQSAQAIAQMQAQVKQMGLQIDAMNAQTKAKQADASIARDQARMHMDVIEGAHNQAVDVAGLGAV